MKPYKHFGTGLIILACVPIFLLTTLLLIPLLLMSIILFVPTLGYSWYIIRGYEYWFAYYTPWGLLGPAGAGENLNNRNIYFLLPYEKFLLHSKEDTDA